MTSEWLWEVYRENNRNLDHYVPLQMRKLRPVSKSGLLIFTYLSEIEPSLFCVLFITSMVLLYLIKVNENKNPLPFAYVTQILILYRL